MQTYRAVLIISILEILIGCVTLFGNLLFIALNLNNKSPNVLAFIIITSCLSTLIGIGILKFNKTAYDCLIYFSSVIILTKFLMFAGIIQLHGELEVTIDRLVDTPVTEFLRQLMNALKNIVSVGYHAFIIYFLRQAHVRAIFHR